MPQNQMQPPPKRTPFFDKSGQIAEEWQRWFLSSSAIINAILQAEALKPVGQAALGLEGQDQDVDQFVIPGPSGPSGASGIIGIPGMDGFDGDDAFTLLSLTGFVPYVGAVRTVDIGQNVLLVGDGTSALPSFAFSSNPAAGFWQSATNQVSVSTSGFHRWAWTSAGTYLPASDIAFDIGASGNRIQDIWIGRSIRAGSVGPHNIGTSADTRAILIVGGNQTGSASESYVAFFTGGIAPAANNNGYGTRATVAFTKASAGTHPFAATMRLEAPGFIGGAAAVDKAAALIIESDTSGANSNYALLVKAGLSNLTGGVATRVKAGAPVDGDFTTPTDGTSVVDSDGRKLWYRVNGQWQFILIGSSAVSVPPSFVESDGDTNEPWVTLGSPTTNLSAGMFSDYATGSWTPVLTAATPGDLAVTYSVQLGRYTRIGNLVIAQFNLVTSAFTYTTATGNTQITGLPFPSVNLGGTQFHTTGTPMHFSGITKAGFTQFAPLLTQGSSTLLLSATASGSAAAAVQITDMPSAGTVEIDSVVTYRLT